MKKRYHSCYVVDVTVDGSDVTLTDSTRCRWKVDMTKTAVGFESWLKTAFMKGISQTLTVFEYESRGDGPDTEYVITDFSGYPTETRIDG